MRTVMVLGGYGNAGRQVVSLLLQHTDVDVIVAGRSQARADAFAAELDATRGGEWAERTRSIRCDALNQDIPLDGVDLLIVAAGSAPVGAAALRACLKNGTDLLSLQLGNPSDELWRRTDAACRRAGICAVLEAGFHPGLPGALVRWVAQRRPGLARARVASVISVDWGALGPFAETTVAEMLEEFTHFSMRDYRDGTWERATRPIKVSFPPPFDTRSCAAMDLREMREAAADLPHLRNTGFYVGGFNPVVDYAVLPVVWSGMKVAPRLLHEPLGAALKWSLIRFSRPPFGTILQLDGGLASKSDHVLARVAHEDAYRLTAAPVVATAAQLLDGEGRSPGVHTQGTFADPERLFGDIQRMGVDVDVAP